MKFAYDSMGRRIRKSIWHGVSGGEWQLRHHFDFIHELNGWNILAERSGGSANSFLRTYAWGADLSGTLSGAGGVGGLLFATLHTSSKTFAYGYDLNGNVTLLVDTASGQAAATYDYGPFGEPIRESGEYASGSVPNNRHCALFLFQDLAEAAGVVGMTERRVFSHTQKIPRRGFSR